MRSAASRSSSGKWIIWPNRHTARSHGRGVHRVRLPGEAGLRRYRAQRADGVALVETIMPALVPWAEKLGVDLPTPREPRSPG